MSQRITRSKTRHQDPDTGEEQKINYVEDNNSTSAMEEGMENYPSSPKHTERKVNPNTFRKDEYGVPCLVTHHNQKEILVPLIEIMKELREIIEEGGQDTKVADDYIRWFDKTYPLSK